MTRHSVKIRLKPVRWPERLWARLMRYDNPPPLQRTPRGFANWLGILIPYRARRLHHSIAVRARRFWLPCPLCGHEFGGHEWRQVRGRTASVPDPAGGPGNAVGICPRCTRARRGVNLALPDDPS